MEQKQLFPLIRSQVRKEISSYLQISKIMNEIEDYITPPKLGGRFGIMGAFALAQQSYYSSIKPKIV